MTHVLILALYTRNNYNNPLQDNLNHYNIKHTIVYFYDFDSIDFSKYSHIILTGSDFHVYNGEIVLTKKQVTTLLKSRIPILAECYGFHLLAYHTSGHNSIGLFVDRYRHLRNIVFSSPLLKEKKFYFFNHSNYIKFLSNKWDVISKRTVEYSGSSRVISIIQAVPRGHAAAVPVQNKSNSNVNDYKFTFVVDAIMKDYSVLGIQYHPEFSKETYDFIYNWIEKSKKATQD